jgi:hypothetical protein
MATKKDPAELHQRAAAGAPVLTTNQGLPVSDDQNSLAAAPRGPVLLEDFVLREKITHFDHERIPERIVHARGSGAHGYFEPYASLAKYTRAAFLQDPGKRTPVFVRFSTVAGGAGSIDTPRDVRGFAVKFYRPRARGEDGARPRLDALLKQAGIAPDAGIVDLAGGDVAGFVDAAKRGRIWDREPTLRT